MSEYNAIPTKVHCKNNPELMDMCNYMCIKEAVLRCFQIITYKISFVDGVSCFIGNYMQLVNHYETVIRIMSSDLK